MEASLDRENNMQVLKTTISFDTVDLVKLATEFVASG